MKVLPIIIVLLLFSQFESLAQTKNLIENSSFEGNPSYKAWKTYFGVFSKDKGGNPGSYVWLNDNGGANDPSISQEVDGLKPGTIYLINGDYRGGDDSPMEYNFPNRIAFAVDIDGQELATFKLPEPVTSWVPFAAFFKATKTKHTLLLRGEINGTNADIGVDNVAIERFPTYPDVRHQTDIWQFGFGESPSQFVALSRRNVFQGMESLFEEDPQFGIHQNTTNQTIFVEPGLRASAGSLLMKVGGKSSAKVKVRFVAPVDATYQVKVNWAAIHQEAQKNDVAVYTNAHTITGNNGTKPNYFIKIYGQETHGFNDKAMFQSKLALRRGEILSFEVARGKSVSNYEVLQTKIEVSPLP